MKGYYQLHQLSLHHRRCWRGETSSSCQPVLMEKSLFSKTKGTTEVSKNVETEPFSCLKPGNKFVDQAACWLVLNGAVSLAKDATAIKQATIKIHFVEFTNEFSKHQWAERKLESSEGIPLSVTQVKFRWRFVSFRLNNWMPAPLILLILGKQQVKREKQQQNIGLQKKKNVSSCCFFICSGLHTFFWHFIIQSRVLRYIFHKTEQSVGEEARKVKQLLAGNNYSIFIKMDQLATLHTHHCIIYVVCVLLPVFSQ